MKTQIKTVYLNGRIEVKVFTSMAKASEHANKKRNNPQVYVIRISMEEDE